MHILSSRKCTPAAAVALHSSEALLGPRGISLETHSTCFSDRMPHKKFTQAISQEEYPSPPTLSEWLSAGSASIRSVTVKHRHEDNVGYLKGGVDRDLVLKCSIKGRRGERLERDKGGGGKKDERVEGEQGRDEC
ncbi:hypothetical protein NQZ68_040276 [Dissostichus eleginoides]|nr:hypothetical protein NQZ68_040276 [Dissostichus eleginoides]